MKISHGGTSKVRGVIQRRQIQIKRVAGESRVRNEAEVYYRLMDFLRERGYDVVMRPMQEVGHVDPDLYYVRSKNEEDPEAFGIYDPSYQTRSLKDDFNLWGYVNLEVAALNEGDPPPKLRLGNEGMFDWRPPMDDFE